MGDIIQPPFTLDFSQVGGPAAVSGIVVASGLDFPYGTTVGADGSLFTGLSTVDPSYPYGETYGWGSATTGSLLEIPKLSNGSFGAPAIVADGFQGVVTSTQTLSNGLVVVDSGSGAAGGSGNRQMSFVNTVTGQTAAVLTFTYPDSAQFNCEHCNGMSLVQQNPDGSNTIFFILGSVGDRTDPATVSVSGLGLNCVKLSTNSIYEMTINGDLAASMPVQVATGLRNPFALSLTSDGSLVIGNNGIDSPVTPNGSEFAADTLNVIPAQQLGLVVPDYGYPDAYVSMTTGQWVNEGDPNALQPLAAFRPVPDSNGTLQQSEGVSGMAYLAPGSFSFVGPGGGEIVAFYGVDCADACNNHNALLYYDFATGTYVPIVDSGTEGVGHLVNVAVDGNYLIVTEMATAGTTNLTTSEGSGDIYAFDLSADASTPEPDTLLLFIGGLAGVVLKRVVPGSRGNSLSH